jgi:hypothetical protein
MVMKAAVVIIVSVSMATSVSVSTRLKPRRADDREAERVARGDDT